MTILEEFELQLVSVGARRLEVIWLVSQLLQLPLTDARNRIDGGVVILAMGFVSSPRFTEIQKEFERLGASTQLVRIEKNIESSDNVSSGR